MWQGLCRKRYKADQKSWFVLWWRNYANRPHEVGWTKTGIQGNGKTQQLFSIIPKTTTGKGNGIKEKPNTTPNMKQFKMNSYFIRCLINNNYSISRYIITISFLFDRKAYFHRKKLLWSLIKTLFITDFLQLIHCEWNFSVEKVKLTICLALNWKLFKW